VIAVVLMLVVAGVSVSTAQTTEPPQSHPQTVTGAELVALRQKAEQGDAAALCQLGTIYEDGRVVPKDDAEAAKWFILGSMLSGDLANNCDDKLDRARKQMPAEQTAEVDKRVHEWCKAAHITLATARKMVQPQYTTYALRAKITGEVLLEVVIGTDGIPVQYRVVRSLDAALDQEAIKAMRQWRFAPAKIGDRAVPMKVMLSLNFSIGK
jgi:TonB family protein